MTDHSILALSFTDQPNWLACKCGQFVDAIPGAVPLDGAWSVHLGGEYRMPVDKYSEQASDEEVADFLDKVANPWYSPPGLKPKTNWSPLGRETTEDRALGALENIYYMGLKCTCEPGQPISRDCPNFMEGDDDDD